MKAFNCAPDSILRFRTFSTDCSLEPHNGLGRYLDRRRWKHYWLGKLELRFHDALLVPHANAVILGWQGEKPRTSPRSLR